MMRLSATRSIRHPEVRGALAPSLEGLAPSCPALCRASTSFLQRHKKDVDGRDKLGHDEKDFFLSALQSLQKRSPYFRPHSEDEGDRREVAR